MGSYLSKPNTEKISSDEVGKDIVCGASSMQGWRISQEDAHNCCIDFDDGVSLFAVYDGHGGHEVAKYSSKFLPDFIKNTEAYKKGDVKQALIDAFLGFDATLATPEIISILKEIAIPKVANSEKGEADESDVEENFNNLYMEAAMPLEQVMAKYQSSNPAAVQLMQSNNLIQFKPLPNLRNRRNRDKGACSSSGASCSSSSTGWNTNETDVSSSSQPCESTSSSTTQKVVEAAGSSEADHVLDSTTSNGDVPRTSQVGSSADTETTKSSEMPDSSEDVNDKVTPSKVTNSSSSSSSSAAAQSEAETNGESSSKSIEIADSSKTTGDNECSSSCTPLENGEAGQQEKISSSGRRRNQSQSLYENFLGKKEDNSDEDDDDDDDENDESFYGQPEHADVDNEDSNEDDDEEDEDDDEDDDDEDDEEDEDDDEYDTEYHSSLELSEEPGSASGCTAVVAILKENTLYVANAGDSRCVLCRDGEAIELSFDHKPEDQPEMDRIVKAGGKVTLDGRVNGGLNLSRALGDHAYKKNKDIPPEEQMISALPDIKTITLDPEKDEFMILACDGIWNFMSSQNVITFIRTRLNQGCEKVSKICEELFDYCLAPNTHGDGTGCDNMTAIIVQFKKSQTDNKENLMTEVTSVSKKRPISPNASDEATDCNTESNVIDECKRMKTETC